MLMSSSVSNDRIRTGNAKLKLHVDEEAPALRSAQLDIHRTKPYGERWG